MNYYRQDIDGLRAIAVLSVVFFHFEIPYFTGGFVGVDIFFVISGYLISSIVLRDLVNNKFSFISFYKRRMLRIFPALFITLFITTIIALILFDYESLHFFGKSLVATVSFASNFYFRNNVGYFAAPPHQITLLHTWSLALEEQFYLIFPILIFLIYGNHKLKIKNYIIIGSILSFSLCVAFSEKHPQFSFYLLPSRAWEFLIGTLLYLQISHTIYNQRVYNFLSILGLVLIFGAVFMFSSATIYPSYNSLLPVLGASLLIFCGANHQQAIGNRLLRFRVFVFIGKISYSLYLWHWVLYVIYKYVAISAFNSFDIIILLTTSIILSICSWYYIEQHFRFNGLRMFKLKRKTIFVGTTSIIVLFLSVGILMATSKDIPWRLSENKILIEAQQDSTFDYLTKHRENFLLHPNDVELPCIIGNKSKTPNFIIWGDSHVKCLAGGLNVSALENNSSIYIAEFGRCAPLQYIDKISNNSGNLPTMSFISKEVLKFIRAHKEIKTVLLAGHWSMYVGHGNKFDSPMTLISTTKKWADYNGDNLLLFEMGLRETIYCLRAEKRNVVLVTDVPQLENYPVNFIVRKRFTNGSLNDMTPKRVYYDFSNKEILHIFKKLKKEGLIDEILSLHEEFFVINNTIIEENNHLLYRDDDHLSYWGAMKVRKHFTKYMKTKL